MKALNVVRGPGRFLAAGLLSVLVVGGFTTPASAADVRSAGSGGPAYAVAADPSVAVILPAAGAALRESFPVQVTASTSGLPVDGWAFVSTGVEGEHPLEVHVVDGTGNGVVPNRLSVGDHQIRVEFFAAGSNRPVVHTAPIRITKGKVTLSVGADDSQFGYAEGVGVRVLPAGTTYDGDRPPSGRVRVQVGSLRLDGELTDGWTYVRLPAKLPIGTHTVTVTYLGSDDHLAGTATTTATRTKIISNVYAAAEQGTYGKKSRITLEVGPSRVVTATGSVVLRASSGKKVSSATLKGGKAVLTVPADWKPGKRTLTISYSGDKHFTTTVEKLTHKVAKAKPKITVAKVATVEEGKRAVVSVRVSGAGQRPTGTVRVTLGAKLLASKDLKKGFTKLTLPPVRYGKHNLTVTYTGDSRYLRASVRKPMEVIIVPKGARSFGNGTHTVNQQVRSGLYRSVGFPRLCEWRRLGTYPTGQTRYLANGANHDYVLVRILPTDTSFSSRLCGRWTLVADTGHLPFYGNTFPGDGDFLVGKDIRSGTYRQTSPDCEVDFWSDASRVESTRIGNVWHVRNKDIVIPEGTFLLTSRDCANWKRVG